MLCQGGKYFPTFHRISIPSLLLLLDPEDKPITIVQNVGTTYFSDKSD